MKTYPNEIRQVLLNLLKNSEEAIEEKGIDKGKIWMRARKREGRTYISIEDNAGGIAEDILGKLFEPYFSTKTKKDGTGLGLYMSRMIIKERCRGNIKVSNKNAGACFELSLPSL